MSKIQDGTKRKTRVVGDDFIDEKGDKAFLKEHHEEETAAKNFSYVQYCAYLFQELISQKQTQLVIFVFLLAAIAGLTGTALWTLGGVWGKATTRGGLSIFCVPLTKTSLLSYRNLRKLMGRYPVA